MWTVWCESCQKTLKPHNEYTSTRTETNRFGIAVVNECKADGHRLASTYSHFLFSTWGIRWLLRSCDFALKLVAKSSLLPQRPSQLRDRWDEKKYLPFLSKVSSCSMCWIVFPPAMLICVAVSSLLLLITSVRAVFFQQYTQRLLIYQYFFFQVRWDAL